MELGDEKDTQKVFPLLMRNKNKKKTKKKRRTREG
jgi:hypothetical protein